MAGDTWRSTAGTASSEGEVDDTATRHPNEYDGERHARTLYPAATPPRSQHGGSPHQSAACGGAPGSNPCVAIGPPRSALPLRARHYRPPKPIALPVRSVTPGPLTTRRLSPSTQRRRPAAQPAPLRRSPCACQRRPSATQHPRYGTVGHPATSQHTTLSAPSQQPEEDESRTQHVTPHFSS